jgi:hypothetical protein
MAQSAQETGFAVEGMTRLSQILHFREGRKPWPKRCHTLANCDLSNVRNWIIGAGSLWTRADDRYASTTASNISRK